MRDLKEVLEQNKEKYIEELKNLVGIDTHDLGHGIDGGLEKQGQEYMVNLFESWEPTRSRWIRWMRL